MERMLKKIGREVKMITADSKEWNMTPKDHLPGGLMSAFYGKYRSLMQEDKTKIGKLGNWMAIMLEHNDKKLLIVKMCRMPGTASNG